MRGNDAQRRSLQFEWISELALYENRPIDEHGDALAEAKISTAAKWHSFRLWMIWLVINTGRYGQGMNWSQLSMAENSGRGIKTVRQWLRAAVALGLLKVANAATSDTPAEYEISPFWAVAETETATEPQQNTSDVAPWKIENGVAVPA